MTTPPSAWIIEKRLSNLRAQMGRGEEKAPVVLSELPREPLRWQDDPHLEDHLLIGEAVAMSDARLIAVATDPDADEARLVLATQLARLLAEQDERVLLLDVAPDAPLAAACGVDREAEGLADLAEYGASMDATTHASGVPGIHVMGPGGWSSDALVGGGLDRALGRIAEAYDRVLVALPLPPDGGHPLLARADAAVLGLLEASADDSFSISTVAAQGIPILGAVLYAQEGGSLDLLVDGNLHSRVVMPLSGETKTAEPPTPADSGIEELPVEEEGPIPLAQVEGASSPLFRRITISLGIALAAFAIWWGFSSRSTPTPQLEALAQRVEPPQNLPSVADGESAALIEDGEEQLASGGDDPIEESAEPPAEPVAEAVDPPAETVEAVVTPPPVATPDANAGLALIPRAGQLSLHLWSFPTESEADAARTKLGRSNVEALVRAVELPGKGTWYRVYVGRFASRGEANSARALILERRDVDYANVTRF